MITLSDFKTISGKYVSLVNLRLFENNIADFNPESKNTFVEQPATYKFPRRDNELIEVGNGAVAIEEAGGRAAIAPLFFRFIEDSSTQPNGWHQFPIPPNAENLKDMGVKGIIS